jgi:hypothetical protein
MAPKSRKKTLDAFLESVEEPGVTPLPETQSPKSLQPETQSLKSLQPKTQSPKADEVIQSVPQVDQNQSLPPPPKKSRSRAPVKKEEKPVEHVIIQLPIPPESVEKIITQISYTDGNYRPSEQQEPIPYTSADHFTNIPDSISDSGNAVDIRRIEEAYKDMHPSLTTRQACFWCCHEMGPYKYGLPISFDPIHQSFHQFGSFCSLECAAAYNFSVYMGSDRMWEIHSWIQLLAKKLGIETPIRSAPSRYLLQMFGGPLQIEEFRKCHKSLSRAYVMNIPPMINVSPQFEMMNVSYIYGKHNDLHEEPKNKLSRKKSIMDTKRTLDTKMNLTYETILPEEV